MNKLFRIITGFVLVAGFAMAESDGFKFYTSDDAPAIRIYNSGSELVKIKIASGGADASNEVIIGNTTNTIDGSGAAVDTVAEFAAAVAACTNSSGDEVLEVDTDCVVATTESTDGELLDEAITVNQIWPGAWGRIAWDTSDVKHYRSYVPTAANGAGRGGTLVESVYGNIGGTGDVTIKGYVDRNQVFEKVITSPVYVKALDNDTNTVNNVVSIDIPVGIYVGASQSFVISADRASTATTGGAGVRLKNK